MGRHPIRMMLVALASAVVAAMLAACATVETAPAAARAEAPRKVLQGSVLHRDKAATAARAASPSPPRPTGGTGPE